MFTDRLARDLESILVFDGRRAIVEPLIDAGRAFVLLLVLAVRLPVLEGPEEGAWEVTLLGLHS